MNGRMVRAIAMCLAAMCVGGLGDDASTLGTGPLGIKGYRNDWTGRYPNADPVTAWDLEKGINVLWKLPTRNYGNGGPLIVGNRLIFVVEPAQLVCVDKMNGKLLWTSTGADPTTYDGLKAPEGVPVSQRPMKYGDHGGLTYATPVTDGKRLWAKLSGVAVCFELATGKRLWETSLHVEPGDHPHNVASPLLVDNVLVCQGGKGDYWPKNSTNQIPDGLLQTAYKGAKISVRTQWMVGLDATTGAILWDVGPMNAGGYAVGGTPVPVVVDCNGKKRKFIVTSEGCAIDPANGRLLIPWVGARNGNTAPWPWGDKIVIGDLIVQFKCSADGKLEIADTRKGGGGGVYHGGRVYSYHRSKDGETRLIDVLDLKSGTNVFQDVQVGPDRSLRVGVAKDDDWDHAKGALAGRYAFFSSSHKIAVLDVGQERPVPMSFNHVERMHVAPVFDGNRMYLRTYDALYCIGRKGAEGAQYEKETNIAELQRALTKLSGKERDDLAEEWRDRLQGKRPGGVVVQEGDSAGWRVNGSGISAGQPPLPFSVGHQRRWQATLPAAGMSEPVALGKRILVADREGLSCLDDAGKTLWRQTPGRSVKTSATAPDCAPVLAADGSAYAVFPDGQVLACDAQGKRRWEAMVAVAADRPAVAPFLAGGDLVVQGADIVCLGPDGKAKWTHAVPPPAGGATWGPPARSSVAGEPTAVTAWGTLIRLKDGKESQTGLRQMPAGGAPVVDQGVAYWAGRTGNEGLVVAMALPTGESGKPALKWERKLAVPATGALVVNSGLVTALDASGNLLVLSSDDGAVLATKPMTGQADAQAGLLLAGGQLLIGGLPGRSVVAALGEAPVRAWEFAHAGPATFCSVDDRLLVRAGNQLHCLAGASADTAPAAPKVIEIPASASVKDVPDGLPVWDLQCDEMGTNWLAVAPLPGRNLKDDPLADRGGRNAAPTPGMDLRLAGTNAVFFPIAEKHIFMHGVPTLDVTAVHERKWETTGMFAVAVRSDRDRVVRLATMLTGASHNRERLDLRVFLGGIELDEMSFLKIPAGTFSFLIQTSMGTGDAWGKVFMRPRFLDAAAELKTNQTRYEERRAIHEAAQKPQML